MAAQTVAPTLAPVAFETAELGGDPATGKTFKDCQGTYQKSPDLIQNRHIWDMISGNEDRLIYYSWGRWRCVGNDKYWGAVDKTPETPQGYSFRSELIARHGYQSDACGGGLQPLLAVNNGMCGWVTASAGTSHCRLTSQVHVAHIYLSALMIGYTLASQWS